MCGIAGIISPAQNGDGIRLQQKLQTMTHALAHRGPDGEAHWVNEAKTCWLGHRRLAIIDTSPGGVQPMHYANRYTIIYNGELYNYTELRETLLAKAYTFRSRSDTEVILAAYHCYGVDCLTHFDGMFAMAIWDEQEGILFAARDRFGEKPFFYTRHEDCFWWASEMKALWAAGIAKKIQHKALLNFITPGLVQDPSDPGATFFSNIQALPPAHYLLFRQHTAELQLIRYWTLPRTTAPAMPEQDMLNQFRSLLSTSVQRRLRSDVPIGTSLSGGIDSSTIAALLHQKDIHLTTFSAIFPGFVRDESAWVKQVTEAFGLINHTTSPNADEWVKDFERLCFYQEEPFGSASVYAQYRVFELAKQHGITVLLDGQGADEVLGGYNRYLHWFLQELWRSNKATFRREKAALETNGALVNWGWANRLAALFPRLAAKQLQQRTWQQQQQSGVNRDYLATYGNKAYLQKPVICSLNDILAYTTTAMGLPELLRYADRNSMAHGREVRLPFLSHEWVTFMFSLPATCKIRNGFTKYLLRSSMQGLLPDPITWRKDKTGFEPPQAQWLQHRAMTGYMQDAREQLVKQHILDKRILYQPLQANTAHEAANSDWRYLVAVHTLF